MTIYEEKEYNTCIERGEAILNEAEKYYENKDFSRAIKKYYSASLNFEMAKEIASAMADIGLQCNAKEKEFYCLEKIDELEQFKNVNLEDYCR